MVRLHPWLQDRELGLLSLLEPDGDRLKFLIRVVCFSEIDSMLAIRLSHEILEEFSLPGFKIDIVESYPVSPS